MAKLCNRSPQSISELSEDSLLTRQAITKHLQTLEGAGVVRSLQKNRKKNLFALDPEPISELKEYLDRVSEHWDQALMRLKLFVRG